MQQHAHLVIECAPGRAEQKVHSTNSSAHRRPRVVPGGVQTTAAGQANAASTDCESVTDPNNI